MAGLAVAFGALTRSGGVAAVLVGTLVLLGAGWSGAAALLAFFVSSSLVSRLERRSRSLLDPKGSRRDAAQVLANGGAAAVGAAAAGLAGRADLAVWIAAGGLAAAGADTWATSIGSLSRRPPRHLLTGRTVPAGTGGGVTLAGTAGAIVGAAIPIAAAAIVSRDPALVPAGIIIGLTGMLADSALGGSVQARFRCEACGVASEWPVHRCGSRTLHEGGWRWLTNDGVNAASTTAAAALSAAWHLLR
ncbi:MAG TPA: DUF92 domain-containing protein [Gemmatimonadales bacterium]